MTTEVLGFLIIVGAMIVFMVRRDLWSGSHSKADEVEEASVKMRLQMEHSADAIIARMEAHIQKLEGLVAAADERARVLEQQMASLRAEQERAQRQAEQEFASLRAARQAYEPERREAAMGYGRRAEAAWEEAARVAVPPRRSMRAIESAPPVRRSAYPRAADGFAEALSASMYDGAGDARYDEAADYGPEAYEDAYGAPPPRMSWARYSERPRAERRHAPLPAELAAAQTPAAVVDPALSIRQRAAFLAEEEDEPETAFSEEELAQLAQMEAEVVVSPSVADVVDLPMRPEDETDEGDADEEDGYEIEEDEASIEEEEEEEEEEELASETPEARDAEPSERGEADAGEEEEPSTDSAAAAGEGSLEASDGEDVQTDEAEKAPEEEVLLPPPPLPPEPAEASAPPAREETAAEPSAPSGDPPSAEAPGGGNGSGRAPSLAVRARALLESGMTPEQAARETGMGRSAVELLAQMTGGKNTAD